MRATLSALGSLGLLCFIAYLGAGPAEKAASVKLRLADADGKPLAGIVRVFPAGSDQPLMLKGLYNRMQSLGPLEKAGWHVVPAEGAVTTLPRTRLRLEALSGLETTLTTQTIDLSREAPEEVALKLQHTFRPDRLGLAAGNTHLHLRNLSRKQADEYLRRIPAADGLRVLFISYLERHKEDATYITNKYPVGDLKLDGAGGVLMNNGEEHRHNFQGFGEGYGHVMFLGIKHLVKPVSLGPGITGAGNDDTPLRPGIEDARKQGGTVVWCHNTFGFEDVPQALAGRVHALNVFDGSRKGSYEEGYYRYLNVGLRLPLSTGTDWFMYDFARVYAKVEGQLTPASWLDALKAGRCVATNGPLLTLKVNGRGPGEAVELEKPGSVKVEVEAFGRHDFGWLELVHSGKVVKSAPARAAKNGAYLGGFGVTVRIDRGGWLAARINTKTKNEMGQELFAHTSPVYVTVAGKGAFDVEAAQGLLRQVEEAQAAIRAQGRFSDPRAAAGVQALYEQAARDLRDKINRRAP